MSVNTFCFRLFFKIIFFLQKEDVESHIISIHSRKPLDQEDPLMRQMGRLYTQILDLLIHLTISSNISQTTKIFTEIDEILSFEERWDFAINLQGEMAADWTNGLGELILHHLTISTVHSLI